MPLNKAWHNGHKMPPGSHPGAADPVAHTAREEVMLGRLSDERSRVPEQPHPPAPLAGAVGVPGVLHGAR